MRRVRRAWLEVIGVSLLGVVLTIPFWPELWQGAGLIGGDATGYFLPQKTYLSDHLKQGDLPLWNNLVAHGYSFVGDSQIAMWYPTTLAFYRYLSVNAAINATFLAHYALAFSLSWFCARRCGLRRAGSLLAALVFTYGYFPVRVSLEWTITTGAWLPIGWACLEGWLRTAHKRWLLLLVLGLTFQLLAGHFNNAWITHVWLGGAALLRTTVARRTTDAVTNPAWRTLLIVLGCQLAAFPLATVQLWPTWEMRTFSERTELPIRDIEYGRIPPWYLKQLVAPWSTYDKDPNARGGPKTNRVAAQIYVGLVTLALTAIGLWHSVRRRRKALLAYAFLSAVALCFAVGWVRPVYQYVPGFGWFPGPGRYAIVFALGTGLLAGTGLDRLRLRLRARQVRTGTRGTIALALTAAIVLWTFVDLRSVGRGSWPCPDAGLCVAFATPVGSASDEGPPPPVRLRDNSPLRDALQACQEPVRLLAPLHNSVSTLGLAVLPGYLGLKPLPYVNEETKIPHSWPIDVPPAQGQLEWLQRAGVTHLLFLDSDALQQWRAAMDPPVPPQQTILGDMYMAASFARMEPFFVQEITGTRGRIAWVDQPDATTDITTYSPDFVEAEVSSAAGGTVVLTDFAYPGWNVFVDDNPAEPVLIDGMFRGVKVAGGQHRLTWRYEPTSVYAGAVVSLVSLLVLMTVSMLIWRRSSGGADAAT